MASANNSGIPDWWLLQYFGTTAVDPYGNPAGDGWNNLQKFQKRLESEYVLHARRTAGLWWSRRTKIT